MASVSFIVNKSLIILLNIILYILKFYYSAKGGPRKSLVRQLERGIPNEDAEEIEGDLLLLHF